MSQRMTTMQNEIGALQAALAERNRTIAANNIELGKRANLITELQDKNDDLRIQLLALNEAKAAA